MVRDIDEGCCLGEEVDAQLAALQEEVDDLGHEHVGQSASGNALGDLAARVLLVGVARYAPRLAADALDGLVAQRHVAGDVGLSARVVIIKEWLPRADFEREPFAAAVAGRDAVVVVGRTVLVHRVRGHRILPCHLPPL